MGVDFEAFGRTREVNVLRRKLIRLCGAEEGDKPVKIVLYAGRLSKEKNLGLLPAMLADLAHDPNVDYRLAVAGDGPFAPELKRLVDEAAPGRSAFVGHCGREDLTNLYHSADIFVHPNPTEPFG